MKCRGKRFPNYCVWYNWGCVLCPCRRVQRGVAPLLPPRPPRHTHASRILPESLERPLMQRSVIQWDFDIAVFHCKHYCSKKKKKTGTWFNLYSQLCQRGRLSFKLSTWNSNEPRATTATSMILNQGLLKFALIFFFFGPHLYNGLVLTMLLPDIFNSDEPQTTFYSMKLTLKNNMSK